ncbi:transporter substrate-binding domain-containing protein [Chamaesiphon sp. GL140_3_metabinner_50]|uniref:transporter substrate-binding domain-containing protein n=1 Tax=Chamaesiphon sp. GL140_3_metabinner_50 TaxID=2970812 RepID=UPI0025EA8617|nr:transporter substrate-binding domain-containing protein [Chamaesiphon sp. GL140_3_metabinner_50]
MKLNRSHLGYIQRWLNKLIMLATIAIATLAIVLIFSPLHLDPVSAQPKPQPSTTATPSAVAPVVISGKTFKIATRLVSPFVTEANGELGGFSIELWRNIAQELDAKSIFVKNGNVSELLNSVKSGQADVGISAISVTSQREQDFDFSQPIFDSGLQILVRSQGQQSSIARLVDSLFTPEFLQLLGMMLLIILIPAHIVWLVERKHQGGFLENSNYFPGIFKTCWWAAATLATQAEEMPKGALGRIMAVIWMFISVVFIAYFTATVTTSLTVDRLQSNIKSPQDLAGKRVATIVNTTSANYLSQQKIEAKEFKQIDEAFNALNSSNVDAVVFDAPILLYYAAHDGKGKVQVVGNIFRKESYAIALPNGSPYRKPINNALLSLQENGKYQEIYDKWFSAK